MKSHAVLLVTFTAATAAAEPRFEILDRGTAIEVIAHDVKATRTAVNPARSRLEVEIAGFPKIAPLVSTNAAVKVVELDGANPRRFSVKLPLERTQVKTLARFAQAIQVGDDLHLLFPREVPADDARVVLPEPTLPKHIAAKLADQAKPFGPTPLVDAKAPGAVSQPDVIPPTAPPPVLGTIAKADPAPDKPEEPKKFLADEEPSSNSSFYAMAGLGVLGVGCWLWKKKKQGTQPPAMQIEVVAQRSLGSKAKVVWLNAGGREMVVAVTQQQVRMLGQWKKNEGDRSSSASPMPFAQALDNQRTVEKQPRAATSSPVAGILKLRERATTMEHINEEVATGDLDADALWAKEIFAAASGSRR
jgi:flagellar biogenesis protein FliO